MRVGKKCCSLTRTWFTRWMLCRRWYICFQEGVCSIMNMVLWWRGGIFWIKDELIRWNVDYVVIMFQRCVINHRQQKVLFRTAPLNKHYGFLGICPFAFYVCVLWFMYAFCVLCMHFMYVVCDLCMRFKNSVCDLCKCFVIYVCVLCMSLCISLSQYLPQFSSISTSITSGFSISIYINLPQFTSIYLILLLSTSIFSTSIFNLPQSSLSTSIFFINLPQNL